MTHLEAFSALLANLDDGGDDPPPVTNTADDVAAAIAVLLGSRQTHAYWLDFYARHPEQEQRYRRLIGNASFHEKIVRRYDFVLNVLRRSLSGPVANRDFKDVLRQLDAQMNPKMSLDFGPAVATPQRPVETDAQRKAAGKPVGGLRAVKERARQRSSKKTARSDSSGPKLSKPVAGSDYAKAIVMSCLIPAPSTAK